MNEADPSRAQPAPPPAADTDVAHDLRDDAPAAEAPWTPEGLPGFTLVARLHSGAQGDVYRAIQISTGRTVALKIMRTQHEFGDGEEHARFDLEVRTLVHLRHPHIVTLYESGVHRSRRYFAMEFIDGCDLEEFATGAADQLTLRERVALLLTVCDAVGHAHRAGVVHRDLKPGNILVDRDGVPHVVDFGLAKHSAAHRGPTLTDTHVFMGTLAYAAPEQAAGDTARADARTDVYALGVILFRLLTGDFPYRVDTLPLVAMRNICEQAPLPPSRRNPKVSRDLDTIVLRALAKEPARRYADAAALASDLRSYLAGEAIAARQDSAAYLLWRRARGAAHGRPVFTYLLVGLAAFAVMLPLGPLIEKYTPLGKWSERLATAWAPPVRPLRHVRLVEVDPDLDYRGLAERSGIVGGEEERANPSRFIRALVGAFLKRLAVAAPRVVVLDMEFPGEHRFNGELIAGVAALREHGVPVVISNSTWWFERAPLSHPSIVEVVDVGGGTLIQSDDVPWLAELCVQHSPTAALPGLALRGAAAYLQPFAAVRCAALPETGTVEVRFERGPRSPANWEPPPNWEIKASEVAPETEGDESAGVREGDIVATYRIEIPSDPAIAAITTPLAAVLAAGDHVLSGRFGGAAVFLGDPTRDPPMGHPGGRLIDGSVGHACALDQLLRSEAPARAPGAVANALFAGGSLIGLLAAFAARRDRRAAIAIAIGAILALVLTALFAYRFASVILNPLTSALGLLAAFAVAHGLDRSLDLCGSPHTSPVREDVR